MRTRVAISWGIPWTVDISTGQGAEEGGERGGAKAAVEVRDEAGLRKRTEGEEQCEVGLGKLG